MTKQILQVIRNQSHGLMWEDAESITCLYKKKCRKIKFSNISPAIVTHWMLTQRAISTRILYWTNFSKNIILAFFQIKKTNTLSKSATLNVTSSRFRHGEFLNADFRATMVSTTSAPTPSATTSPFYLLRDDPRELITSYFCMNSVTVFLCFFNSTSLFFCSHTARNKW